MEIPLEGPLANKTSEVSGLAWWGDRLILLPQYPERWGSQIFALDESKILDWLDRSKSGQLTSPLFPEPIAFENGHTLAEEIEGFEGFEAIAFRGQTAFLTVEAETREGAMGYVVRAQMVEGGTRLVVDADSPIAVRPQSVSENKAEEALLLAKEKVVSIYEVNGERLNAEPVAHAFDLDLSTAALIPFPSIEYRITDVTGLDERDRFWAINYFYPGDRDLDLERDPIALRYGQGETHRKQEAVERLVELVYTSNGIELAARSPIQLVLSDEPRNWEGIVRLEDRGFLLVTDKFPRTIFGFVEMPDQ